MKGLYSSSIAAICLAAALGCSSNTDESATPDAEPQVVEVIARGLEFVAPEEVKSGWVTFRFVNESEMVHFAIIERMPEGYGIVEQQEQIAPVFQAGMDELIKGDIEAAHAEFGKLPEWFSQIVFYGGPGLTSPKHSNETTLYLEPGTYLLECYVKTGGIFHSYNPNEGVNGMVHEFQVVEQASDQSEPAADVSITLSKENGIQITGDPRAGQNTIAVQFLDQTVYENFVGHDLHLFRIAENTDLDRVESWMDWRDVVGLQTPSPAEFIGGTQEMPEGSTCYLHLSLEPGRYVWISEVPGAREKGLLKEFLIDEGAESGS